MKPKPKIELVDQYGFAKDRKDILTNNCIRQSETIIHRQIASVRQKIKSSRSL